MDKCCKKYFYGTRAANAARINAAICVLQLPRRVLLSVAMRFTVGGDAEHYTVGANAAFLPLLVQVLPFTILLGSMLAKTSLHMFGQILPVTERLQQLTEILRFTAVIVQVGISRFDAIPLGANSLSIRLWAYTPFLPLVLIFYYPF